MERWDILLLVIGAVVAVGSLVRLMRNRRDLLVAQVRQQLEQHRRREAAAKAAGKKKDDAA